MIQIGIAYLLPFILIFIFFGKLCNNYDRKSELKIFLALLTFFGTQATVIITASFFIVKFNRKIDYLEIIAEHGYKINILAFVMASAFTFLLYKITENRLKQEFTNVGNEIEHLGEK